MYYYIVDPPRGTPTVKIAQRLQELITPMGISGEVSIANPARSAEELAYMGIDKGYTTIIAVGGEELANTIATILINESREKLAFGIIPINAGDIISQMIGVANNDIRAAVEVIRQRHLDLIDVVQLSSKKYMLTEAIMMAPRVLKINLDIDQKAKVELEADWAHLSNDLVLTLQSTPKQDIFSKTLSFVGIKSKQENLTSQFHGKQIRFTAHEPLPIIVAGQVVAKTPTTFTKIPAALKLITARAILPTRTMSDFAVKNTATNASSSTNKEFV